MAIKRGDKVLLLGGGGVANEFHIVRFLRELESDNPHGQVELETNDKLPNPSTPYLWSWRIAELPEELKDLPLGHYLHLGDVIVDAESIGLFTPVTKAKVVKRLNR